MGELVDYMTWKNVGSETRSKVLKYYEVKYRGKFFEEKNLLDEMNESLRTVNIQFIFIFSTMTKFNFQY
jgi:ribulose kinase